MRRGWLTVVLAIVLVGAGFGIGYAVADGGHGADATHGLRNDRMAGMMADGSMTAQMDAFIETMKDLRSKMTPQMQARIEQDAMWQLMESGELMQMMRKHEARMGGMPGMSGGGHGNDSDNHGSGS